MITVVGGMNMDIIGTPTRGFTLEDSNIGRVTLQPGGVGRNIARQLAFAGMKVTLLTALGNDAYADMLRADCANEGVDLSHALQTGIQTSMYMCILDEQGEVVASVNDMPLTGSIAPLYIARELRVINTAPMCVLEANLSAETLLFTAEHAGVPLFVDPVNSAKAPRVLPILPHTTAIKPNLMEARTLTGCRSYQDAGKWLLDRGVKVAFISLGADGVYYTDKDSSGRVPAKPLPRAALTGAGDAMCAGLVMGLIQGKSAEECAVMGVTSATDMLLRQHHRSKVEE